MLKRLWLALLTVLVAALAVAGCGGGTTITVTPQATPVVHVCTPDNFALQCALTAPPQTLKGLPKVSFANGVDFAWGAPSVSTMTANGWKFAEGYLSYDSSKNWTRARLDAFHAAGINTGAVWETSATRAAQGCAAGIADSTEAVIQLAQDHAPAGTPFTMAIDFDATGLQVAPYFTCAHAKYGDRVNAYGGYYPILYLCQHGLVGHLNWQAYAWSRGLWNSPTCAPVEQVLNGSSVDYDRLTAPLGNIGGWLVAGTVKPPPPVDTHHIAWYRTDVTHHGRSERKAVQLYRGAFPHKARYPNYVRSLQHDLLWFADRLDIDAWKRGQRNCQSAWPCPEVWDTKHRPELRQGWRARHFHIASHDKAI